MSERDRDRYLEQLGRQREEERNIEQLALMGLGLIVGAALVVAAAGWLDSTFGWGLKDWLIGLVSSG